MPLTVARPDQQVDPGWEGPLDLLFKGAKPGAQLVLHIKAADAVRVTLVELLGSHTMDVL